MSSTTSMVEFRSGDNQINDSNSGREIEYRHLRSRYHHSNTGGIDPYQPRNKSISSIRDHYPQTGWRDSISLDGLKRLPEEDEFTANLLEWKSILWRRIIEMSRFSTGFYKIRFSIKESIPVDIVWNAFSTHHLIRFYLSRSNFFNQIKKD
ncbi:hypothetical protein Tco_1376849 [Tanacetum coccineum]|uniref:Uncharacterized protein n=1 Tax=Tanacetum coccineum TaxID=301880 RepID=A0ABQ5F2P6_9ASTR